MLVFQRRKLRQRWDSNNAQTHTTAFCSYRKKGKCILTCFSDKCPKSIERDPWGKEWSLFSEECDIYVTLTILTRTLEKMYLCEWYKERRKGEKAQQGKILWTLRIILQTNQFYTLNGVVKTVILIIMFFKVPLKRGHWMSILHIFLSGNFCTMYYRQRV